MSKIQLHKPTLIMLYGYPGAGKTYFARQFCEEVAAAHVHDDKIRHEIFERPRFDKRENQILQQLMQYMTEEFLKANVSVVFDTNAMRLGHRRLLRDLARKFNAKPELIWLQIDAESAYQRSSKRDRRKADDKYGVEINKDMFAKVANFMQNPSLTEEYIVLSGKHTYDTQSKMLLKKFYDGGLLDAQNASSKLARPELMNRIPNPLAGRVDNSRRNIRIR
ncbi:MAG: ATP-binding protein [Candidatus Saccharibacteria bacterium]|nr:ATP-binding protein [Candidatus Saccharibacteria bacterium]